MDIVGSYGGTFANRTDKKNCMETITDFLREEFHRKPPIRPNEKSMAI
jgi:hypothetical protein